jgi:hypothetical protein
VGRVVVLGRDRAITNRKCLGALSLFHPRAEGGNGVILDSLSLQINIIAQILKIGIEFAKTLSFIATPAFGGRGNLGFKNTKNCHFEASQREAVAISF